MRLGSYIKQHRTGMLLFVLISAIWTLLGYLYGMPGEGLVYAWILCGIALACAMGLQYVRHAAHCARLEELAQRVALELGDLPEVKSEPEMLYQLALENLWNDRAGQISKLEEKLGDMGEYYTLWAHQIKTPIAALRLLLREDTPENQERLAELFRIEQYVEMVLSYIRLESEHKDRVLGRYSLEKLVKQSVRKYAGQFIQSHVQLELGDLAAEVLTDEKWLCFAIEQILSNAVKYTPPRGKVRIYAEEGPVLCIRDTGIGIAPEDLPRIGEKGFTGYNGRSDKKATGLGLYLCQRVLSGLGHALAVESSVGSGTTVRIDLKEKEICMSD